MFGIVECYVFFLACYMHVNMLESNLFCAVSLRDYFCSEITCRYFIICEEVVVMSVVLRS